MRIIDCTLRDGGYHNGWNFSKKFAEETLETLISSGISDIEIGFRKPLDMTLDSEGIFANINPNLLEELAISSQAAVGVMINVSDYISESTFNMNLLKTSFPYSEPKLKFVRLAGGIEHLSFLSEPKKYLEDLGYEVHLNLMRINNLFSDGKLLSNAGTILRGLNGSDFGYLTLADTYGVIRPNQLKTLIEECLQNLNAEIGLHMHNNLGLATSNSMLGLDLGVSMLDSTLTGMGRGPGNLRTEFIVGEISERAARTGYDLQKLLAFTAKTYEPLKDFYKWGENSYYYLGAQNMIHPTYIQYLTQKNDYSAEEIIEAISNLGAKNEIHFSEESLNFVIQQQNASKLYVTKESATPFLGVSTVTILGAGDTLKDMTPGDHRQLKLMSGEKLLSLTLRPKVDRMLIDGYIILDPVKYFIDYKIVESHQSAVVTPFNLRDNTGVSTHNYTIPFTVEEDRLDINDNGIILPFPSSLGYALMTLVASGVTQFKLAGFDGFGEGDLRQSQNQTILDLFNDRFGENHQVTFITATTYRVPN